MPEPAHSQQPLTGVGAEHSESSRPPTPFPRQSASAGAVPGDGTRRVVVRGELDLDTGQRIRSDLGMALGRSPEGIELDLSQVAFCDCSGLNLLLCLRRDAKRQGKTVTIRATSPAVDRMLDLTGTLGLFVPPGRGCEDLTCPITHEAPPDEDRDQDLTVVVAQLRRAMRTRPTIDLARGILMSSFSLSPEAAWDVLVTASQNTNTKLHQLAGDVVGTVRGSALPAAVRKQLEAAIAKNTEPRAPGPTDVTPSLPPENIENVP
ncbi:ANTAR domain-containing protein [Streptomyces sp. NPDC041068]|uniref:ANTAR domain-containing protein n=1 Tax=Streptomyces sp. NPDC041068 TaxID=3155130 RepID=UPI0034117A64